MKQNRPTLAKHKSMGPMGLLSIQYPTPAAQLTRKTHRRPLATERTSLVIRPIYAIGDTILTKKPTRYRIMLIPEMQYLLPQN